MTSGLPECGIEADRRQDLRDAHAARLLAALPRDPHPALGPFSRGFEETSLTACRGDRKNLLDAELGGLLDHPFETIELDQRGAKRDADRQRCGRDGLDYAKDHPLPAR